MALKNFHVVSNSIHAPGPLWVVKQDERAVQRLAEHWPEAIYFADEEPDPIRIIMRYGPFGNTPATSTWNEDTVQDLAEDRPDVNYFFVDVAGADV
jgi:hypothetical protein